VCDRVAPHVAAVRAVNEFGTGIGFFDRFAGRAARFASKPWFFGLCLLMVIIWVLSDFVIGKGDVPTKDKIFEGAYALGGDDLGGLVYPMRFSTELPRKKIGCGWAVVNTKGKSTSDGQMFCLKGLEP